MTGVIYMLVGYAPWAAKMGPSKIGARAWSGQRATLTAALLAVWMVTSPAHAAATPHSLALPAVGERTLRILSLTILELTAITAGGPTAPAEKGPPPVFPPPQLEPGDFDVTVDGTKAEVQEVGFKRRAAYAPLKQRDLRIGNWIYLRLAAPVGEKQKVEVNYRGSNVAWLQPTRASAINDPQRHSPAIHVNQVGYGPKDPKIAIIGYYLGSLGELAAAATSSDTASAGATAFLIVQAATGKTVHRGSLTHRPDRTMPAGWYRRVWEADFSKFETPGEYRVVVPGLGTSYPFFIDEGTAATFARTYALGLYHQRCGAANALPFTRFLHEACHTGPAEVPTTPAAQLRNFPKEGNNDLFPILRKGKVDVSGGHHDAGDYSKYTINSAGLVHHLITAVDAFAGAASVDNLGLPESGDGKSDLLQIAKWESDFLAKLQDDDGGFHFLVYPRDRLYEQDVLPDKGDPQIVWPKNTAATAAAVAALAQCASSQLFQKEYPADAKRYLAAALRGWKFLQDAQAKHPGNAYRKFTHYGDDFKDMDELAWAVVELYLATGDPQFVQEIATRLDPRSPETRKWGWRRMTEGYGRAIRSYALAVRTGRVARQKLDSRMVARCEDEIIAAADELQKASREGAYGTSYPEPTKRVMGGGWYFPLDQAFDLAVACQLDFPAKNDRRPHYRDAVIANLNYEAGCNPVDVCFLTGLGWKRPIDIVHQYAQNDRRFMPVSGIPLGAIQDGFHYMDNYRGELGALCYPLDGSKQNPYPILDRWGDSFNLQTEFVVTNQARGLAVTAWLLAQTELRAQKWKPETGEITGVPSSAAVGDTVKVQLRVPAGYDLTQARIVWEARDQNAVIARDFAFSPKQSGPHWIEADAQWPDGRRVVAIANFSASGK